MAAPRIRMNEVPVAERDHDGLGLASRGHRSRTGSLRQRDILDQLQALFMAEGFRHFTIGDLVDRLRCSRRTLYSLAPSKEELVLVVIGRLLNEMGVRARAEAAQHSDPGDAIAVYLQTA